MFSVDRWGERKGGRKKKSLSSRSFSAAAAAAAVLGGRRKERLPREVRLQYKRAKSRIPRALFVRLFVYL